MTELGNVSRKAALVLGLVALIVPYEMEIEVSGPLDAQRVHRLISSMIWAIETNGYRSMIGSWETTQFLLPHCCLSEYATVLLLINLFLVFLIMVCLDGMISRRTTVYALILSAVFPLILSGLVSFFREINSIILLPIPAIQLTGLFILRYTKSVG